MVALFASVSVITQCCKDYRYFFKFFTQISFQKADK